MFYFEVNTMKITSVRKGKGAFYIVHFDNKDRVRVSEDLLVSYRLFKDRELTDDEFIEIKRKAGFDIGFQLAMNHISYQLRSEKEVRIFLKGKEVALPDVDAIIDRLKELQVLDDDNYAKSYVRTKMRLNDKGPQVIKRELIGKGISADKIEQALDLYLPEIQEELALHAAEKVIRQTHGKSHRELLDKIRQNLFKKGFSNDIIQSIMDQLDLEVDQEDEWEALTKEGTKQMRRLNNKDQRTKVTKIKQKLFQKGFSSDMIQKFIDEEVSDGE